MLSEAANVRMVAYSTFSRPFRPSPEIMPPPMAMPPMAGSFVACVLEERPAGSVPVAAIIFEADLSFDSPKMPRFILQLIDSVDVIRKLSRRSCARVVASRFVLNNPLAELDRQKCQEIFYWQYLGYTQISNDRLM